MIWKGKDAPKLLIKGFHAREMAQLCDPQALATHTIQLSLSKDLINVHLNWLNWFCCLIFVGGPVIILIDCMIFLFFCHHSYMLKGYTC